MTGDCVLFGGVVKAYKFESFGAFSPFIICRPSARIVLKKIHGKFLPACSIDSFPDD
jgi:hypothetical protein